MRISVGVLFAWLFSLAAGISPLWPEEAQTALKRTVALDYTKKSAGGILDDLARKIGGTVEFDSTAFGTSTSMTLTLAISGEVQAHQAFSAVGDLLGLDWEARMKPAKGAAPRPVVRFFKPPLVAFPKALLDKEYGLVTDAPMPLVDVVTRLATDVGVGVAFAPGTYEGLKDMVVTLSIPRTPLKELLKLLEIQAGVSAEVVPLGNQFVLLVSR